MATLLKPDICIIGGGSAGLSVAAGAAAFGVPVVLIERDRMGGDCLNVGCVPSKALIAAARHAAAIRSAAEFGVTAGEPVIDFAAVHAHVHGVIAGIAPHDSVERFTGLGVTVLQGDAVFEDKRTVRVGDTRIQARRIVVATGSRPFVPQIAGLDTVPYLTNETLFDLTTCPEHLVILGAGPIGLEMAQAHRRLGAKVTVIAKGRPLEKEDPELVAVALAHVRADGVEILENTEVSSVAERDGQIVLSCTRDKQPLTLTASHLLVATGRQAATGSLQLDKAGIAHGPKGITVNSAMRSSNSRVYAIGDAAGGLQFTHAANYHAGLVLQQILFRLPSHENRALVPRATYTDPQIAVAGLTEAEAKAAHGSVEVLRWPYAENDRARTDRETDGLIKIIVGKRGKILGVGIVGAGADEMINLWSMVIANGLGLKHVRGTISPYPTMTEIGKRAVLSYYAPWARSPLVRRIVSLLRSFG